MRWLTNAEMGWGNGLSWYDRQEPWVPKPAPVVLEKPPVRPELLFAQALPRQIVSLIWRDLKDTPLQIPSGGHTTLRQLSTIFGGVFTQYVLYAPVEYTLGLMGLRINSKMILELPQNHSTPKALSEWMMLVTIKRTSTLLLDFPKIETIAKHHLPEGMDFQQALSLCTTAGDISDPSESLFQVLTEADCPY